VGAWRGRAAQLVDAQLILVARRTGQSAPGRSAFVECWHIGAARAFGSGAAVAHHSIRAATGPSP
jgi:hypothetical protein